MPNNEMEMLMGMNRLASQTNGNPNQMGIGINAMPIGMGMGVNAMPTGMAMGENRRGKKVFSQNIRENVKNALSSLRERVGKAKEEVERDFERTKEKIKKSFDRRNERKPDMSNGYYDLAVESIDVNSFDPANYPSLRKKRVPNFVKHAINLIRNLGLDATIEKLERQSSGQYANKTNKPIEENLKADYSKLKQDIANAFKQLKTAAVASGTTNEVAIEVPIGMENLVVTEQSIPRTSNPEEAMNFDGRMRRGRNGLSGFVNATGSVKDCYYENYITGYTSTGNPIVAKRLVCPDKTTTIK